MVSKVLALSLFVAALPALAAELEGVKLQDRARVDGQDIVLNGIALRTRYAMVKVYVAALYLPQKTTSGPAAIDSRGAKRMVLVMLRDVGAEQFIESFDVALRRNNSDTQLGEVQKQQQELFARIRTIGEARAGAHIVLDYLPSAGTRLVIDGAAKGMPIPGEAFYRAILRSWLGEKPSQESMKKALLGQQ
jgi:hypothetical protein